MVRNIIRMSVSIKKEFDYINDLDAINNLLTSLGYNETSIRESIESFTRNKQTQHNSEQKLEQNRFKDKRIGIVGFGAMGKMYAKTLSKNHWNVNICDLPEHYAAIKQEIETCDSKEFISLCKDHIDVIKNSDFTMFCTEAHVIRTLLEGINDKSILLNKIISGQSSSKTIEVVSLLEGSKGINTDIIALHSMHGPNVPSKGQPLAIVPVRLNNAESLAFVDAFTECFESEKKYLTFMQHDKATANTQGLTHCVFINMGKAWFLMGKYPWLYDANNTNELEVFKVNLTFRIYGNSPHVYSNLAMMNPFAINAIKVFSDNCDLINDMIVTGRGDTLFAMLVEAYKRVFKGLSFDKHENHSTDYGENTHLSLLSLLKTWDDLGIDPMADKFLATPLYKLLLSSVVKLFSNLELLAAATKSTKYKEDDKQYVASVKHYSTVISSHDTASFNENFEMVAAFFKGDAMEIVKQKAQKMILELSE